MAKSENSRPGGECTRMKRIGRIRKELKERQKRKTTKWIEPPTRPRCDEAYHKFTLWMDNNG